MNLIFEKAGTVEQNGRPMAVMRAVIDKNDRVFWRAWRTVKPEIQRLLQLRLEGTGAAAKWCAYRLVPLEGPPDAVEPFALSYQLRDSSGLLAYQPVCVSHLCDALLRTGACADGSDTGIGKTYTALKACTELGLTPAIVCRRAGIAGWKRACIQMGVTPFFIVNWEHVKTARFPYAKSARHAYSNVHTFRWKLPDRVALVFDEAHMANHDSTQNNRLYVAARDCGVHTLSLSATFADHPHRLRALFHVLGVVHHDAFPAWMGTEASFTNAYGNQEWLNEGQIMARLCAAIYPHHGYRLSYDDPAVKAYFPDAVHMVKVVTLPDVKRDRQNALYAKLVETVAKLRELGKHADAMVADLRYRQMSELLKADAIAETAQELMYEGKSVVVFVNFRETLAYLAKALDTRSLIYGGQDGRAREMVIDNFQRNISRVVLSMIEAGGQSISLHDLHGGHQRVSLICPTYNPVTLQQVLGRTRRAGSRSIPIMALVYAAGTVEEKVADSVQKKLQNIRALNEGDLTETELFDLGVKR